jgi:exodeoxyribonuclease V beta subunit
MSGLEYILPENDPRIIKSKNMGEVMGMMNGLMDMFFEHNGKYYILDWKSNFLGDSLDNYNPTELNEAMNESNYHLQYMLYTLAAKKFLNSRLPDFNYEQHFGGVIYVFLRGVRKGKPNGIYAKKPSSDEINTLDTILSGK